jgi:uncharacterized protein YecE (DUF72 family)
VTAQIRVGTSGYSFADWAGTVYPQSAKPGEFLGHYARLFDAVEINATYYRVPSAQTFANMLRRVTPDFMFVVKLPREMTHERAQLKAVLDPFTRALDPLSDAGQLGGLLAQFPWEFKPSPASHDHLRHLAESLAPIGAPVNVEFRHASWYDEETCALLRDLGFGFVNVDLPALPDLPTPSDLVTSEVAYFRLHGRNRRTWWSRSEGDVRYDYLYDRDELEDWVPRIERAASKSDVCYIFANNCHLGQSVVNALELADRFSLSLPGLPPGASREMFPRSRKEWIAEIRGRIRDAKDKAAGNPPEQRAR